MKIAAPFSFSLRFLIVAALILSVLLGLVVHAFLDMQRSVANKHKYNKMAELINRFPSVVSNLNGRWPKDWKETGFESRLQEVIEIDFALTIEDLQNNPNRIYTAIRFKGDASFENRQLEYLRDDLLAKHGTASHAKNP